MADYSMVEIKQIIRSIAISGTTNGLSVKGLATDFKKMEGFELPYQRMGFRTVDEFLRSLTDTVTVTGYGTSALVEPVVTQSNRHIRDMVLISKTNSRRRPNNKSYCYSSYRAPTQHNNNYGKSYGQSYGKTGNSNGFWNRPNDNRPAFQNYDPEKYDAPRKVSNKEYDFLDTVVPDGNDSGSSEDGPTFVLTEDKKLAQVEVSMQKMKVTSPEKSRSEGAIPDNNVLALINSLEIPEGAMNLTDMIEAAKVPESIVPKQSVQIFVTEVHNPNRLWFHFGETAVRIDEMMNEIDAYYSHLSREEWRVKPANVAVGLYCAAKFLGLWHRAKIVSDLDHNKIKVFYIDYGTVSEMELKDVKFLAKCFASMPSQAMRASLAYVKPVGQRWTRDASWSLLSLVYEKILYAYVVDVDRKDNFMDVVLIDTTGTKDSIVNQQLFIKGHAIWEQDVPYKDNSTENFRGRTKSYCELFPKFDELESGEYPTLLEIGEYHLKGFKFERYFIQSLQDDNAYLQHALTRTFTILPKMIINAETMQHIDFLNEDSCQFSFEDDYDFYQEPPSDLEFEAVESEMIDEGPTQVEPEVKDTVKVPVVKTKKQVRFMNPEREIIPPDV